jgi:multiple sugar transport system permease protein
MTTPGIPAGFTRALRFGLLAVFTVLALVVILFPIVWQVRSSFMARQDIYKDFALLPANPIAANYAEVLGGLHFARAFANTCVVTASIVIGTIITCSMAGFAFAHVRFPGRSALFYLYLGTMMLPFAVTLVPSYWVVARVFHWVNTLPGLIAPAFLGNAMGTFLMRQFYASQPRELIEASFIDGASWWTIWRSIMVPLSTATLLTLTVITLRDQWNSFLWPVVVIQSDEMKTLAVALKDFLLNRNASYGTITAGVTVATLPMMLMLFIGNKAFLKGVQLQGVNR